VQDLLLYWLNPARPEPVLPVEAGSDRVFAALRAREE
jgi:hypothetical protein